MICLDTIVVWRSMERRRPSPPPRHLVTANGREFAVTGLLVADWTSVIDAAVGAAAKNYEVLVPSDFRKSGIMISECTHSDEHAGGARLMRKPALCDPETLK